MFERIQSSSKALRNDLYTAELTSCVDEKELTLESLKSVNGVLNTCDRQDMIL